MATLQVLKFMGKGAFATVAEARSGALVVEFQDVLSEGKPAKLKTFLSELAQ